MTEEQLLNYIAYRLTELRNHAEKAHYEHEYAGALAAAFELERLQELIHEQR